MSDDGLVREYETFIRCCDVPPKVECCDCPNGISSLWDVQDDLSGMYSHTLAGLRFAWGCDKFENPLVKRVEHYAGPFWVGEPGRTGECHWFSQYSPPSYCCALGCPADGSPGGLPNLSSIGVWMSCYIRPEVPPVDPIYGWWLDCACDDLWYGDSSEWGSLEDCQTYDTNCHCSNDKGAFLGTDPENSSECEYTRTYYEGLGLTCSPCEWRLIQEGYPGYPRFVSHTAGLSGSGCACNRAYVHLNPLDPLCKDMLDSVDSSNLEPFDCEGCNTYVLIQYHAMMVDGVTEAPNYPCCLGCGHICNGADLPCMDCGCGEGPNLFACYNYPATLTLCPSESINLPASDSDCNPDVLCCGDNPLGMAAAAPMSLAAPAIPEDSLHFQFLGTSTQGYLKKDGTTYKGEVHPIVLEVDREARTLNGKPLSMLSEDIFWGRGRIGNEMVGFMIEVME